MKSTKLTGCLIALCLTAGCSAESGEWEELGVASCDGDDDGCALIGQREKSDEQQLALEPPTPRGEFDGDDKLAPLPVAQLRIINPHKNLPHYLKGQMHAHSDRDWDGEWSHYQLANIYRSYYGYSFIGITNHAWSPWNGSIEPGDDPYVPGLLYLPSLEDGYSHDHHLGLVGMHTTPVSQVTEQCIDLFANGVCDVSTEKCRYVQQRIDYGTAFSAITTLHHPRSGSGYHRRDQMFRAGYTNVEIHNTNASTEGVTWWDEALSYGHVSFGVCADDYEKKDQLISGGWILVNSEVSEQSAAGKLQNTPYYESNRGKLRAEVKGQIKAGNFFAVRRESPGKAIQVSLPQNHDPGPKVSLETSGSVITVTIPEDAFAPPTQVAYFRVKPIVQTWLGVTDYGLGPVSASPVGGGKWAAQLDVEAFAGRPHDYRYIRLEITQERHGETYTVYSQPLLPRYATVPIPDGSLDYDYENRDWLASADCATAEPCKLQPAQSFGLFNNIKKSWLDYGIHNAGVQLVFAGYKNQAVALHRSPEARQTGAIRYGETFAISVTSGGQTLYLRTRPQADGIGLGWSGSPLYEWQAFGGTNGASVHLNQPFGVHNTSANDDLVYCGRDDDGVSLEWRSGCSSPLKGRLRLESHSSATGATGGNPSDGVPHQQN